MLTMDSNAKVIASVVAIVFFMLALDGTIIVTSLPIIANDFNVEVLDMSLSVTAYLIATATFIPASDWLIQRFGTKLIFLISIVLFTLASFFCGATNNFKFFVFCRVLQGLGGAVLLTVGRIIILDVSKKNNLIHTTALITWPGLFAPILGPLLGGLVTVHLNWRYNFFINIPLGLACAYWMYVRLPEKILPLPRKMDWMGLFFSSIAMAGLLVSVEIFSEKTNHNFIALIIFSLSIVCTLLAIRHLRKTPKPLFDLSCAKIATFRISTLSVGGVQRIIINSIPFLLPLLFQLAFDMSPYVSGLLLLVYFLGNLVMKSITTRILKIFGFKKSLFISGLCVGLTIIACGLLDSTTNLFVFCMILFLAGMARSMQFTAQNTLAYADVPAIQRGSAVTIGTMWQQAAGALGVSFAVFLLNLMQNHSKTDGLGQFEFSIVFAISGLISFVSAFFYLRLPLDAGIAVTNPSNEPQKQS